MNALYGFWHGMVEHLWQATLILALILIIERTLRGAPSRVIHTLWSIGLIKIFLPLSLIGGVSSLLYRAAVGGRAGVGEAAAPMLQPVVAVLYPLNDSGAPPAGSTLSYTIVAATAVWAAFALYFVARIAIDAARARRHGGMPLGSFDTGVAKRLEDLLASAGIPSDRVLLTAGFVMPTVTGLVRPRIVIPEYLARELQEEELRAILLHEETHRRRRDPLRAAAHRLGQALFFFYPLIYPVLRRLQSTAEFACDESVVHSGVPAHEYSRALARTLELGLASPAFATAAVAGSSLLRRRLKRLSTPNPRRYAMRLRHRILIVIAALAVAAATLYPLPMEAGSAEKPGAGDTLSQGPDTAEVFYPFDEAPSLIEFVRPSYPEEARKLGVEATVLLDVMVDDKGTVTKATVIEVTDFGGEALPQLDKAKLDELRGSLEKSACEAAMKWKFKAATFESKPVKVRVAVPVRFKLH